MAKKQTRRSISVSRTTYERLKAFCETNNISMSQLVETRVNDFLGTGDVTPAPSPPSPPSLHGSQGAPFRPAMPRPVMAAPPRPVESSPVQPSASPGAGMATASVTTPTVAPAPSVPLTSAAARFVVEPPPPIIKPRQDTAAPKPAEKRPEQIFTF
jgi:hypothetical protein